uniref:F-box domain-containing protein n=1 Tax=Ditylenchus dipsaci TaxID=166011 RepID=A0A915E824_9BILA
MLYEILCYFTKKELIKLSLISQHTSHLIYSHFLSSTLIYRQDLYLNWTGDSKNFLSKPYSKFDLQPFSARVAYKCLRFENTQIRIFSADHLLEDLEPLKHLWDGMRLEVEITTSMSAESVELVLESLANKPNQLKFLFLRGLGDRAVSYQLKFLLNPLTMGCKHLSLDGILCEASEWTLSIASGLGPARPGHNGESPIIELLTAGRYEELTQLKKSFV